LIHKIPIWIITPNKQRCHPIKYKLFINEVFSLIIGLQTNFSNKTCVDLLERAIKTVKENL